MKNKDRPDWWDTIKYFTSDEIRCPCGCGSIDVDEEQMRVIDRVRRLYDKPIKVNSCVRCERHNKSVGGSPTSSHLTTNQRSSNATDIHAPNADKYELVNTAMFCHVRQIGVYRTFLHLGTDPKKPRVLFWGDH